MKHLCHFFDGALHLHIVAYHHNYHAAIKYTGLFRMLNSFMTAAAAAFIAKCRQ